MRRQWLRAHRARRSRACASSAALRTVWTCWSPCQRRGEVDDFEVFVEHVKPLSADEDFGVSRRKLDLGGHHGEEELTVGVRLAGVGFEVIESEIALLAIIVHCGDWEQKVVCVASVYWYATLSASRIERCVIVPSFDWKRNRFLYEAMRSFWKSLVTPL